MGTLELLTMLLLKRDGDFLLTHCCKLREANQSRSALAQMLFGISRWLSFNFQAHSYEAWKQGGNLLPATQKNFSGVRFFQALNIHIFGQEKLFYAIFLGRTIPPSQKIQIIAQKQLRLNGKTIFWSSKIYVSSTKLRFFIFIIKKKSEDQKNFFNIKSQRFWSIFIKRCELMIRVIVKKNGAKLFRPPLPKMF